MLTNRHLQLNNCISNKALMISCTHRSYFNPVLYSTLTRNPLSSTMFLLKCSVAVFSSWMLHFQTEIPNTNKMTPCECTLGFLPPRNKLEAVYFHHHGSSCKHAFCPNPGDCALLINVLVDFEFRLYSLIPCFFKAKQSLYDGKWLACPSCVPGRPLCLHRLCTWLLFKCQPLFSARNLQHGIGITWEMIWALVQHWGNVRLRKCWNKE